MIVIFPALSLLICTSPPACPIEILCGFRKASLFSFTQIVFHPRPFFYNIHLAPTRKAIKTQRKLELSHIYVFTASSLEFTKITGCLKKNKLWKYMYRYTYSEFLQEQTSMMVIISVPAETESSHLTLEAAKLRWCHITVKWDSIASHTKTTLNTFRHGKGQKKQR